MLVECGFTRAAASDGREWTFSPSLARIAALGAPHEIVELFAALHQVAPTSGGLRDEATPNATQAAAYVLACLCDQDDPTPLIGWRDADDPRAAVGGGWHPGQMPAAEQVILARHLMRHGIVGKARPEAGSAEGGFSHEFRASEYIAAACVHLGLSRADAEALSMTEFQTMFEMKFPRKDRAREVPTREEYEAAMKTMDERERANV